MNKPVMFSVDGYSVNSADNNNEQNIIPSGDITMENVDIPVHGIDNLGNEKNMEPGKNYKFAGDYVLETPLEKKEFKAHNMYSREKAGTYQEHLDLKEKGYKHSPYKKKDCTCWDSHKRVPGTKPCAPGSCEKK